MNTALDFDDHYAITNLTFHCDIIQWSSAKCLQTRNERLKF